MDFQYYYEGTNFYWDCESQEVFTGEARHMPRSVYEKRAIEIFKVLDSPDCEIIKESVDALIEAIQPQIKGIQSLYLGSTENTFGDMIGQWKDSQDIEAYNHYIQEMADLYLEYDEV